MVNYKHIQQGQILLKRIVQFQALMLVLFSSAKTHAQHTSPKSDSLLIGTWKGSSLCQIKNSPCHDETVVYHIYKKPLIDTFYIQANKIVNGVEEDMGIVPCLFIEKSNQLVSTAYRSIWTFQLKKDELEGTLVFQGNLYRKIKVLKLH